MWVTGKGTETHGTKQYPNTVEHIYVEFLHLCQCNSMVRKKPLFQMMLDQLEIKTEKTYNDSYLTLNTKTDSNHRPTCTI